MYIATSHWGYVVASPRGRMTGRSIPSASMTMRVATRPGSRLGDATGGAEAVAPIRRPLGRTAGPEGPNTTLVATDDAVGAPAVAGPTTPMIPAAIRVTPAAVRAAGASRSRR